MTDQAHATNPPPLRLTRTMTAERVRRYSDFLHTTSGGDAARTAPPSIHTASVERPQASGLPARIAEGMVVTNWIASMLAAEYGERFLQGGAMRTKFIRPIHEDLEVTVLINAAEPLRSGRLRFSIECVSELGVHIVGDAEVVSAPGLTSEQRREAAS